MTPLRAFLLTCLATLATSEGQIFADFTLSTGTGENQSPLGSFRVLLEHERAPRPVANFIGLATGERPWLDPVNGAIRRDRYYDGQIFHRLIHNFVIQGGDILGTGQGGPGYVFQDQFEGSLRHSGRYILSMAKSSLPNSNGSQFFITLAATPNLDDRHSVFGEVISGREVIDGFADASLFPTDGADRPVTAINLDSVVISGPDLADFDLFNPELRLPIIRPQTTTANVVPVGEQNQLSLILPTREASTFYRVSGSTNLASLVNIGSLYSADAIADFSLTFDPFNERSFFARIAAVDYSLLRNPPLNLASANRQFVMRDRIGNELTMTFLNESSGTWIHSNGGSGSFTANVGQVGLPLTGTLVLNALAAAELPLSSFVATFDSPVGPAGWLNLDLVVSFHDETSGFVDGSALVRPVDDGPIVRTTILEAFTYVE